MKFTALIPQRESNIKTILGDILALPTIKEGVEILQNEVVSERHTDLPIEFTNVSMEEDGAFRYDLENTDGIRFQYTKHALSQATVRIKPEGVVGMVGYLAACPPDLRSINFNFWHQQNYGPDAATIVKNDVLLRTRFGKDFDMPIIRAVVSQSYVPIDDLPLLKQFESIIPAGARARSVRGDIKSRYDAIWPTMKKTLVRGEPLVVAVRLSNSEAGTSSVRLEPMVYGMGSHSAIVVPLNTADVSIRHIGEAGTKLVKCLDNVLGSIDPFIEMLDVSYTDSIIDRFETLDQLYATIKKAFELNDSTLKTVRDCMFKKDTRADVIEALARAADDLPIEDGEHLQKCAGLLTARGWKILTRHITAE